jgi:hypothetical protein
MSVNMQLVDALKHCYFTDWSDFAKIRPNEISFELAPHWHRDRNFYLGDNEYVEITTHKNVTLKYRNFVVLGVLQLTMPGESAALKAANIFICSNAARNLSIKTKIEAPMYYSSKFFVFDDPKEFRTAAQYLLDRLFKPFPSKEPKREWQRPPSTMSGTEDPDEIDEGVIKSIVRKPLLTSRL